MNTLSLFHLGATLLFFLFPSVAKGRVETKAAPCHATWSAAAIRLETLTSATGAIEASSLRFVDVQHDAYLSLEMVATHELHQYVPEYISDLLKSHPDVEITQILVEAHSFRSEPESLVRQESDYWYLRYQHFWGGGLQHPRLIRKLAALEIRANYLDRLTGRDVGRLAREQVIFEGASLKLKSTDIGDRLDAVSTLAEIGTEPAMQLLEKACREDDKLAVRSTARLALLARGRPVVYDPDVIRDIRMSRVGVKGTGESLAYEELARLPDEALSQFLENTQVKLLDSDHSQDLFRNRSLAFIKKYLNHEDSWIRGSAIRGLRGRVDPESLRLLVEAVTDPITYVSVQAVEGLAMSPDPAVRQILQEVYDRYPNSAIRVAAKSALMKERAPWVPDGRMKSMLLAGGQAALVASKHLQGRDASLVHLALRSTNSEVRLQAISSLKGRGDPEALRLAISAFSPQEPVVEVRLAALEIFFESRTTLGDMEIQKAYTASHPRIREAVMKKAADHGMLLGVSNEPLHQAKLIVQSERHRLEQFENGNIRADHRTALEAAEHVYDMPEATQERDPAKLVEAQKQFLNGAPRGQRIVMSGSDPTNGYKFYYSIPRAGFESQRRVFSVGGSQELMDFFADVHMGVRQLDSPFFAQARERLLADLAAGHDIDITGHSLGGMPAGVMAYQLQEAAKSMTNPGKVRLITWNGLGARDVLQWQGQYKREVGDAIDGTNYHVPGDIVWRLGNRLGKDIELPGKATFAPLSSHVLSTVGRAVENGGLKPLERREFTSIARIAPYIAQTWGWIGDTLQALTYRKRELETLRTLLKARVEWARLYGYQEMSPDVDPWSVEVDIIRQNYRARKYERGLRLIDSYEAMREAVLSAKRKPPAS